MTNLKTLNLTLAFGLRSLGCAIAFALSTGALSAAIAQVPAATILMAQASSINGSWKLLNMTAGGSPMPMLPISENPPNVQFAGDRVAGTGGCNRFLGGFTTNGNNLDIGTLGSTMMACEEGVAEQERRFVNALQGAQSYEISNDGFLTISYQTEEGTGVLRFAPEGVRALW